MPPSPKAHIRNIKPPVHGGTAYNAYNHKDRGFSKDELIDFSTCCNPYGPPKGVTAALPKADIEHYPDPYCSKLIAALSKSLGLRPDNIIVGSGATELIRLAVNSYAGPGDTILIPFPTYGEYELAGTISNCRIVKYRLMEKDGFKLGCEEFIEFAKLHQPSIIFLCNPNNPTGQYLNLHQVSRILDAFPDILVVLDEAYIAFTERAQQSTLLLDRGNLLIIRSMTKDYAIAGLRLGYGIAPENIIMTLTKVRPPWNVNAPAQQAGLAALSYKKYIKQCEMRIRNCKKYLEEQLTKLGYQCIPSSTNFFIFKTGNASHFKNQMLDKGILVRDCTSFGLPGYVRIAPQKIEQCRRFIREARKIKAGQA